MFVCECCSELSNLIEREKLKKKANVLKYSSRCEHTLMLVQLVTKMNWLHVDVKRSEATKRPNMVKEALWKSYLNKLLVGTSSNLCSVGDKDEWLDFEVKG